MDRRTRFFSLVMASILAVLPVVSEAKKKKPTLKPYCHCKCRFEKDGGAPMMPVEHDVRIQTDDCGDLGLKKCAIEGQEGDGYLTQCSEEPVYEVEKLVISDEWEILPVDPGRSDGGANDDLYDEVQRQFGKMHYRRIVALDESHAGADLELLTDVGMVKIRDEKVEYQWALISDAQGEFIDFFLGSSDLGSSGTAEMTHGEADDRLQACKKKPRGQQKDCINQLIDDIYDDCAAQRMETEECRTHCWFNVCKWCAMDCGF